MYSNKIIHYKGNKNYNIVKKYYIFYIIKIKSKNLFSLTIL